MAGQRKSVPTSQFRVPRYKEKAKKGEFPDFEVGGTPFQAVRFIHDWTDSVIAAVCENPVKTK